MPIENTENTTQIPFTIHKLNHSNTNSFCFIHNQKYQSSNLFAMYKNRQRNTFRGNSRFIELSLPRGFP